MIIDAIDALAGQRAALEAPADQQMAVYTAQVSEPLRPLLGRLSRLMPPGGDLSTPEGLLALTRQLQFYMPEYGVARGLEALDTISRAGLWENCIAGLREAEARLDPAAHGISIPKVAFSAVLANPDMANFMQGMGGYTGFGSIPGVVLVMLWPTDYNIPRLPSATAHEFNHNVRLSFEPWTMDTSVGQYIVLEGLAEAFAGELFGDEMVGPWAQALSEEQVAEMRPRMREAIDITGFNQIRGYIFGDWAAQQFGYEAQGIPSYAGYTIGYRIVRAYMARTGKTATEATYVPWREIVEESAYL